MELILLKDKEAWEAYREGCNTSCRRRWYESGEPETFPCFVYTIFDYYNQEINHYFITTWITSVMLEKLKGEHEFSGEPFCYELYPNTIDI